MSCLLATACVLAAGLPAIAGKADGGLDLYSAMPGAPAESGKPVIGGAPTAAPEADRAAPCAPPLPCGARLLGSVRKDGTIELRVPALRW